MSRIMWILTDPLRRGERERRLLDTREVPFPVPTPDQDGTPFEVGSDGSGRRGSDSGWDVGEGQAAASPLRAVGPAPVDGQPVVDRDLAGSEDQIDGSSLLLRVHLELLIDAQQIALAPGFPVLQESLARARDHSQTAVFQVAVVHGVPDRNGQERLQAPVA